LGERGRGQIAGTVTVCQREIKDITRRLKEIVDGGGKRGVGFNREKRGKEKRFPGGR